MIIGGVGAEIREDAGGGWSGEGKATDGTYKIKSRLEVGAPAGSLDAQINFPANKNGVLRILRSRVMRSRRELRETHIWRIFFIDEACNKLMVIAITI